VGLGLSAVYDITCSLLSCTHPSSLGFMLYVWYTLYVSKIDQPTSKRSY
jgi:hypothetical protein